jgi:hypothetical protein
VKFVEQWRKDQAKSPKSGDWLPKNPSL